MKELESQSFDNVHARIDELKRLFPEAVSEGKLDYDMLMALLGDEFDNDSEKYQFTWKGKLDALRLAQKRSTATLRPCPEESVDWDTTQNLYIEGDNLEVLKLLQQGYLRKVKMIYIDPPYNTGNDFVYEDDFADPIGKYRELTGQTMRANPETAGRYHSNWLNMMYPRLKIAKTLLRDDGVIFISIDDNEEHNLRKVCDEVFGEYNFVAKIVRQKKYAVSNDDPGIASMHEYLLVYQRSDDFKRNLLPRTEKQLTRYNNPDNDPRGDWSSDNYISNNTKWDRPTLYYPIKHPKTGQEVWPSDNRAWRYSKENHEMMEKENRLYWGPDMSYERPRVKRFLSEIQDGVVPSTWWPFTDVGHNDEGSKETAEILSGRKIFTFPKPLRFLKQILILSTNAKSRDIVVDFFSGSSSTAHAIMQLNAEDGGNRKFIMVQIPEVTDENSEANKAGYTTIAEIGKERIRRAGAKIKEEAGLIASDLDTGFRVFKLDSSNLKQWDDSYVDEEQLETLFDRMESMFTPAKPGRSDADILYEIFLKYGIALTEPYVSLDIDGKRFYGVGENGYLFICLERDLTVEIVERAAEYAPGTMIFARDSFPDANAITNAAQVLEKQCQQL